MSRESDMAQGEGDGRELSGGDGAAWRYKGAALGSLGRYEEALRAFEKAVEIDQGDGAAWRYKGAALVILGRHYEAVGAFEKAVEIDESDRAAWRGKGAALGNLGRYEEALRAMRGGERERRWGAWGDMRRR